MSRIFDALQRSNSEGIGYDFPLMSSLAEEAPPIAENPEGMEEIARDIGTNDIAPFQSLEISPSPDSRLVGLTHQASLGAEKFRFLGVRLRQLQQSRPVKTVLITSTIPEEGKSMVSANLAVTLAQRKSQKVLLIDGDLRRPSLSTRFGVGGTLSGLAEWLQSDLRGIAGTYHVEKEGFWFLPAGAPPENNLELMQAEKLATLLNQLADWFDWIVIDSPPVVPLADASVWMRSADGILLVAREGTTQKRQLQRGLQTLETSKLLGVVWNGSTNDDHDDYYQRYVSDQVNPATRSSPLK